MSILKVRSEKELPKSQGVESSSKANKNDANEAGAKDAGRTIRNEPASDPWIIGSSIVRRNEPDDED